MRKLCLLLGMLSASMGSAIAAPVLFADNGHYYEFIAGQFTWSQATADAATRNYLGQTGYLATITSAAENTFVTGIDARAGWAGGADTGNEGNWTWRTGPEAGTAFTFTAWLGGEPNGGVSENELLINHTSPFSGLTGWNDSSGFGFNLGGYYLEYNAPATTSVPEPASLLLVGLGLAATARLRRRA